MMSSGDDSVVILDDKEEPTKNIYVVEEVPDNNSDDGVCPVFEVIEATTNFREVRLLLHENGVAVKSIVMDVPFSCNEMDILNSIFSSDAIMKDDLGYKLVDDNFERRIDMTLSNDPKCKYHYMIGVHSPVLKKDEVVDFDDCHIIENVESLRPLEHPSRCSTPKINDSQETCFESLNGMPAEANENEKFYSCLDPENDIDAETNAKNCDELIARLYSAESNIDKTIYTEGDHEMLGETSNRDNPTENETSGSHSAESKNSDNTRRSSEKTVQLSDSLELSGEESSETSKSPKEEVLAIYPPLPARGGITIYKENYKCLGDGEYLNDVIIDFYLKYLVMEVLSKDDRNRTHVFSSQFFTRLSKPFEESDVIEMNETERRHAGVQRWTKNVNIFEKDFVIVPVNENFHWNLAIICFPGMVGLVEEDTEKTRPCILIFDSIKNTNKEHVEEILRGYLQQEYLSKMGEKKSFNNRDMRLILPWVPKQINATDCGLYVLQYVEQFFKCPITDFRPPIDLSQWFKREIIRRKREKIANLVADLAYDYNSNGKTVLPTLEFPPEEVSSDDEDFYSTVKQTQSSYFNKTYSRIPKTRKLSSLQESCSLHFSKKIKKAHNTLDSWVDRFSDESLPTNPHNLSLDVENSTGAKSHIFQRSSFSDRIEELSTSSDSAKHDYRPIGRSERIIELAARYREQQKKNELKERNNEDVDKRVKNSWIDESVFQSSDPFYGYSFKAANDERGISPSTRYCDFKIEKKKKSDIL